MGSRPMIVLEIRFERPSERAFLEHDHVIEALATNGSDHSLYIGSLPRRARGGQNFADADVSHLFSKVMPEDSVAVAQQVAGEFGKGKCLPQLLSRPLRGRVGGNVKVQNAAPVMGQNQENVKNLEADRRNGEEINRDQLLGMSLQEGAPRLRRWLMAAQHVFADTAFSDVDAEFEKFPMDARCTPTRILLAHLADQVSDFVGDEGSSGLPAPHLPSPEQSKAGPMPGQDRFWLDDGQR